MIRLLQIRLIRAILPWKEVFTDPKLQEIIQLGLDQNTDLQSAMLNVKQAEASFMSARMAYAPSLVLSPQGGVSSFNKSNPTWTWSAPVAASWEIDLFGKLLNSKRKAKVALLQSEAYKQADTNASNICYRKLLLYLTDVRQTAIYHRRNIGNLGQKLRNHASNERSRNG